MINYQYKKSEVTSITWELKNKILSNDKLATTPEYMKIGKLDNNGPFNLASVALQTDLQNKPSTEKTNWFFTKASPVNMNKNINNNNRDNNNNNNNAKGKNEETHLHSFITTTDNPSLKLNENNQLKAKHTDEYHDIWTLYDYDELNSIYPTSEYRSWDENDGMDHSIFLTDSTYNSEILFKDKSLDSIIIEHDRLIKDVIYLLVGSPSLCFRWYEPSFILRRSNIRLRYITPAAIKIIIDDMLLFGTIMKNLENTVQQIKLYPENYGAICVSFASCLSDLLIHLQYTILSIFPISNASKIQLKEIHHRMEVFFMLLKQLNQIIYSISKKSEKNILVGHYLLSSIYKQAEIYDDLNTEYNGFYKAIYMSLFIHSSLPWLNILKKWVLFGECDDLYQEFFISDNDTLIDSLVPCFIDLKQAEMIHTIGMKIKQTPIKKTIDLAWWHDFIVNDDIDYKNRDASFTMDWLNKQAPILTILSNPNIEQSSLFLNTFKKYMQWQNEDYVPPLSIIIQQQILTPILEWYQLYQPTTSTSLTSSISMESKKNPIMNRHDVLFTFWENHEDEYPSKYYVDEKCPSFNIATTFLNHSS
ncbi:unnamed protein product [Cunninghamella blakesleeana]